VHERAKYFLIFLQVLQIRFYYFATLVFHQNLELVMGKYRILEQHGLNYLTLTIVGWIDIFSRQRYRDIVIESLKYCQEHKGLHVNAYVIMSNHIHLVGYAEGHELSHVLRDFKKFTANQILKAIQEEPESRREWLLHMFRYFANVNIDNRHFQVWQGDNHPIALWSLPVIWQKAGIVAEPEHYLYSSAVNYAGGKGLLEVELLEPMGLIGPVM
jgi:putative transposase